MGVGRRPAVDNGEGPHAVGMSQRQIDARKAAQCVTHEVTALRRRRIEDLQNLVGHVGDGMARRKLGRPRPPGAALIIGDHAIAGGESGELRRPVAGRAAEAGRQQNRRGVRPFAFVDVEDHVLPICATVAISISASFFTRPHWMQ